jgi:uncharacterized membrane protein SirB2
VELSKISKYFLEIKFLLHRKVSSTKSLAMSLISKKLSAHLETGRISNLPTVWSNVFLGLLLAQSFAWKNMAFLAVAASFLYVGGCYLGDARDVEFDRNHRPSRPIPSGVLSRSLVWGMAVTFMAIGLCLFAPVTGFSLSRLLGPIALTLAIIAYALFHKQTPWIGLPLIGACRGLLVWSAMYGISSDQVFFGLSVSLAVAVYTICFASVARLESRSTKIFFPNLLRFIMLALPGLCLLAYSSFTKDSAKWMAFCVLYLIFSGWLLFAFREVNKNKGLYVSRCLAGFALLDATLLSIQDPLMPLFSLALFLFSLILQRIASAT